MERVEKGLYNGMINKKGNWIVNTEFSFVGILKNGLIRVRDYGKWGFVDDHGDI